MVLIYDTETSEDIVIPSPIGDEVDISSLVSVELDGKRIYQSIDGTSRKDCLNSSNIQEPGIKCLPFKSICMHAIISDRNGTRRIRQVSRWYLLKYWLYKTFKIDLGL